MLYFHRFLYLESVLKAEVFPTHTMNVYMWNGGITPFILILSTSWRCHLNEHVLESENNS